MFIFKVSSLLNVIIKCDMHSSDMARHCGASAMSLCFIERLEGGIWLGSECDENIENMNNYASDF